jgi:hypothetical protein
MAIDINIGSKLDAKGFKQAETETDKLSKGVKNLAKSFGLAFGTAAVLNYAKASVRAAADDQKAQQQLALALKNVGLERDASNAEAYIKQIQTEFGIVDDLLRPAYQRLAIATSSTAETQKLMSLALDISASTGKDVNAVTTSLSRAYLGNNTALSRLGVGLSKADLKTKSFEQITDELAQTFAGSATVSANTFSGQLAILSTGAAEASEIIGTGLIDALTNLGEDKSAAELATNMQDAATYIADVIRGVGVLAAQLKSIPGVGQLDVGMIPIVGSYLGYLQESGKKSREILEYNKNEHRAHEQILEVQKEQDPFLRKELDRRKKILAAQKQTLADKKKQLALDKASAILAQGQKVFDEEGIQLAAAAQGKLTEEERARLALKTDIYHLEAAINEGNVSAAAALANSMVSNAQQLAALRTDMIGLNDIENPFTNWLTTLQLMAFELSKLANVTPMNNNLLNYMDDFARPNAGSFYRDPNQAIVSATANYQDAFARPNAGAGMGGGTVVNVNIAGSLTAQQDLENAIINAVNSASSSGVGLTSSRIS